MADSSERAVGGRTRGDLSFGDTVTFQARHFGLTWRLTCRITAYDPPQRFVDERDAGLDLPSLVTRVPEPRAEVGYAPCALRAPATFRRREGRLGGTRRTLATAGNYRFLPTVHS